MSQKAPDFLQNALDALKQRAVLRDQPDGERSAARAAAILSAWEGGNYSEEHIWRAMIAIKLAREVQGQFHGDDYTDLAGYAGLLGECRSREVEVPLGEVKRVLQPADVATQMARKAQLADWGFKG